LGACGGVPGKRKLSWWSLSCVGCGATNRHTPPHARWRARVGRGRRFPLGRGGRWFRRPAGRWRARVDSGGDMRLPSWRFGSAQTNESTYL
jgi:hypothetical protein